MLPEAEVQQPGQWEPDNLVQLLQQRLRLLLLQQLQHSGDGSEPGRQQWMGVKQQAELDACGPAVDGSSTAVAEVTGGPGVGPHWGRMLCRYQRQRNSC